MKISVAHRNLKERQYLMSLSIRVRDFQLGADSIHWMLPAVCDKELPELSRKLFSFQSDFRRNTEDPKCASLEKLNCSSQLVSAPRIRKGISIKIKQD